MRIPESSEKFCVIRISVAVTRVYLIDKHVNLLCVEEMLVGAFL